MPRIEPGPGGQDHHTSLKIGGLQPKQSRKMFERIQIMKKSRAIVFHFLQYFCCSFFARFCHGKVWNTALESLSNFVICLNESKPWKKAICALYSTYIHWNPLTLLLTSHDLANKVWKLVLTLKLSQEPKNAMRLHEVGLNKGWPGLGLSSFCWLELLTKLAKITLFWTALKQSHIKI